MKLHKINADKALYRIKSIEIALNKSVIVQKLVWRTDRQTDGQTDRQSANL